MSRVLILVAIATLAGCGEPTSEIARGEPSANEPSAPEPIAERAPPVDPSVPEPIAPEPGVPEPLAERAPPVEPSETQERAAEPTALAPVAESPPAVDDGQGEEDGEEEALAPLSAHLAQGPLRDAVEDAAMAGLAFEGAEVDVTVTHRGETFLLVRAPDPAAPGRDPERSSIYLVRVRAVGAQHRRESGALLYDFAVAGDSDECESAPLGMTSELRARDLDGDGEVEITVIALAAAIPEAQRNQIHNEECGLVAFLVGADDLAIQARLSRRHHLAHLSAGTEMYSRLDTTWRLEDVNGDGRADLRVTESYRHVYDFMGDYLGEDDFADPEHERRAGRRSVDCPYVVSSDRWECPAAPPIISGGQHPPGPPVDTTTAALRSVLAIGQSLFRDRAALAPGARTPWPEW